MGGRRKPAGADGDAPFGCALACLTHLRVRPLGPDFGVAPTSRIPTAPRDARHIPTATEGRATYPYGYSFGPVS